MRATRTKQPAAPPSGAVSDSDRDTLIRAFRSGLISAWKRDGEQAYRLTVGPKGVDAYVEASKLTRYLDGLQKTGA